MDEADDWDRAGHECCDSNEAGLQAMGSVGSAKPGRKALREAALILRTLLEHSR